MTKTPIVRPVSWLNASINLLVLIMFVLPGAVTNSLTAVMVGAMIYLGLSILLRRWLGRDHRRGILHCRRQDFARAIPHFERSLAFFQRHPWIDKYRALTMLSSAAFTYREMGLVSLAFCHAQLGEGNQARRLYEQCLGEYPENGLAQAALRLMDAAQSSSTAKD